MAPDLLPELIMEILNRVPVRDRARCRCVCKSWCSLISHLSLKRTPKFLVLSQFPESDGEHTFTSYDMQGNLLKKFHKNNFYGYMSVNSTCLDFVCMVNYEYSTACLCNPTTEELMFVPLCGTVDPEDALGIGYAASTKEFKIIHICDNQSRCVLFTAGTDYGWRAAESPPFFVLTYEHGAFVNGSIHFLPEAELISGDIHEIALFGVEKEEWGRFAFPPICSSFEAIVLRELTGCLCVVVFNENYGQSSMDIWSLRNSDWVKEYCFTLPLELNMVPVYCISSYVGPLFQDDDGNLLLALATQTSPIGAMYRVKCNANKVLDFQVLIRGRDFSTSLYLENYLSFERMNASR